MLWTRFYKIRCIRWQSTNSGGENIETTASNNKSWGLYFGHTVIFIWIRDAVLIVNRSQGNQSVPDDSNRSFSANAEWYPVTSTSSGTKFIHGTHSIKRYAYPRTNIPHTILGVYYVILNDLYHFNTLLNKRLVALTNLSWSLQSRFLIPINIVWWI